MTVLLDTDDLGEAEEVLSASYAKQRHSAPRGSWTHVRVLRTQLGPLIADEISFSHDLVIDADPAENIVVCRNRSGLLAQQFPDGRVDECYPGEATVAGGFPSVAFRGELHCAHYDVVTIGRELLGRVALPAPHLGDAKPIQLTSTLARSPAANRQLVTMLDYVRDAMRNAVGIAEYPLLLGNLEQALASTLVLTLPSTALLEPTIEDRHDSTPVLLRRAVTFIDDNAHRDISLVDIADAVYVTPRALQYMFRKHRDCTPMEYVRAVRLHHAQLELAATNRMQTTVARVAARWGFGHLGRFATA